MDRHGARPESITCLFVHNVPHVIRPRPFGQPLEPPPPDQFFRVSRLPPDFRWRRTACTTFTDRFLSSSGTGTDFFSPSLAMIVAHNVTSTSFALAGSAAPRAGPAQSRAVWGLIYCGMPRTYRSASWEHRPGWRRARAPGRRRRRRPHCCRRARRLGSCCSCPFAGSRAPGACCRSGDQLPWAACPCRAALLFRHSCAVRVLFKCGSLCAISGLCLEAVL